MATSCDVNGVTALLGKLDTKRNAESTLYPQQKHSSVNPYSNRQYKETLETKFYERTNVYDTFQPKPLPGATANIQDLQLEDAAVRPSVPLTAYPNQQWSDEFKRSSDTTENKVQFEDSKVNPIFNFTSRSYNETRKLFTMPYVQPRHPQDVLATDRDEIEVNEVFSKEFELLESEIFENQKLKLDAELLKEQHEFKEIATSIHQFTKENGLDQKEKFQNSKFLGLINQIKEGEVTIKKDENVLETTKDGNKVGNEYFPVEDEIN